MFDANIGGLYLTGSRAIERLNLQCLKIKSDVHLSQGFIAERGVELVGARIDGQVACIDGKFFKSKASLNCNEYLPAFDANVAHIGAALHLSGEEFLAKGEVNLVGAKIKGQVSCTKGTFSNPGGYAINANTAQLGSDIQLWQSKVEGAISCLRINIDAHFFCGGLKLDGSLNLDASRVKHGLYWQNVSGEVDNLNLRNVHVGTLIDDAQSWDCVEHVQLSGLSYDRLDDPLSITQRLKWLRKNKVADVTRKERGKLIRRVDPPGFNPGPWSQLAKTLDKTGQRSMAAHIRFERDKSQNRAEFSRGITSLPYIEDSLWPWIRERSLWPWLKYVASCIYGLLFGYGHKPARALIFLLCVVGFAAVLYGVAFDKHQMAPNSAVILTSEAWQAALANGCDKVDWDKVGWDWTIPINQDCVMPLKAWNDTAKEAVDYETFHPVLYAVDLFVPLDALGQETTWAPARDRGWWGWLAYAMRMPIQMAGWIITAVGAAVLTGLVGRKD